MTSLISLLALAVGVILGGILGVRTAKISWQWIAKNCCCRERRDRRPRDWAYSRRDLQWLLISAPAVFFSVVVVVEEGTIGVPFAFGRAMEQHFTPGLTPTSPWIYARRVKTTEMAVVRYLDRGASGGSMGRGREACVVARVPYRVVPENAHMLFAEMGLNHEAFLTEMIESAILLSLENVGTAWKGSSMCERECLVRAEIEGELSHIFGESESSSEIQPVPILVKNIGLASLEGLCKDVLDSGREENGVERE